MAPPGLTTGVEAVDDLIDQVRVGDNLVFVLRGGAPGAWIIGRFLEAARQDHLIVFDTVGQRANDQGLVLDWSHAGDGQPTATQARGQLADADANLGAGSLFAVDSLTNLAAAWGDQAALDLFLWACPRLFGRGSIALWLVDGDRHDDRFLRRLTAVTQVVVSVTPAADGAVRLRVEKADGRPPTVAGRTIDARLDGDRLVDVGRMTAEPRRFGDLLRGLRESRGIGQAELARRIGVSPSALSQAERGVRSVSADTLMRALDTLGVQLADTLEMQGYRVNRRSTPTATPLGAGITGRRIADGGVTVWHVTVEPRTGARQPLFGVKATEVVTVLRGVLDIEVGGRSETLQEGDSLEAMRAAVTGVANPADTAAEVLWVIGQPGDHLPTALARNA